MIVTGKALSRRTVLGTRRGHQSAVLDAMTLASHGAASAAAKEGPVRVARFTSRTVDIIDAGGRRCLRRRRCSPVRAS
jgi:hypothetical protein